MEKITEVDLMATNNPSYIIKRKDLAIMLHKAFNEGEAYGSKGEGHGELINKYYPSIDKLNLVEYKPQSNTVHFLFFDDGSDNKIESYCNKEEAIRCMERYKDVKEFTLITYNIEIGEEMRSEIYENLKASNGKRFLTCIHSELADSNI